MPLPILGALVVFGIGGIVFLVHMLRMSAQKGFDGAEAARAAFSRDHPEVGVADILLAEDARAALLPTGAGLGLSVAIGAGAFTRLCAVGDIRRLAENGAGLRIDLADFSAPRIEFAATSPERRAAARRLLEPYLKEPAR